MRKHKKNKSRGGYSLIEVLTVITIIGILAAIAAFGAWGVIDVYRVNGAARQIMSDLQSARLTAIKQNRLAALEITSTSYCIKNRLDSSWTDGCTTTNDTIVKRVEGSDIYTGVTATFSFARRAVFRPDGTCDGDYTVRICKGRSAKQVAVNRFTGNIQITNIASTCP